MAKLQGHSVMDNALKRLPDIEKRNIQARIVEKLGKCAFSVLARKIRLKETIESTYKKITHAVTSQKFEKREVELRYLRSSRVLLCHDFCSDVQS